jgi:uncharacterized protein YndB with AHSA1/START domain
MWFDVEAVPLSFTESSPHHIEASALIDAPPARVFEIMATGEGQKEWFQDFVACRWTSAPPHGVGAEREIELKALTVKERFLAWEPGKRLAFCVYGITVPLVSAMIEDMTFEDVGGGRATRFVWRVHYRPSLLMKVIHPIGRAIFGEMFRNSAEGLARYAKAHQKP